MLSTSCYETNIPCASPLTRCKSRKGFSSLRNIELQRTVLATLIKREFSLMFSAFLILTLIFRAINEHGRVTESIPGPLHVMLSHCLTSFLRYDTHALIQNITIRCESSGRNHSYNTSAYPCVKDTRYCSMTLIKVVHAELLMQRTHGYYGHMTALLYSHMNNSA